VGCDFSGRIDPESPTAGSGKAFHATRGDEFDRDGQSQVTSPSDLAPAGWPQDDVQEYRHDDDRRR
jgi:hypothetical protein